MPIHVISQIKPINNAGFPVVEDIDIKGGLQIKQTTTDRDNIPEDNRKEGMLVYVVDDGKFYTLTGGVGNVNWGESSVGSGGGTVVPIGGTLSGTYTSNVLCEGSASITGTLEIQGDLIMLGTLYNDGGYQVDIKGSLYGQDIDFTKFDTSTPQSNFTVDGDLIFTEITFPQCGGTAATLRVNGNLTGISNLPGSTIDGNAVDETSGLNVTVFGDLTAGAIGLDGGSSSSATPAGSGGTLFVYGNCNVVVSLSLAGGDNSNGDAGNGGQIGVENDFNIVNTFLADLSGGSSTNGNAGDGGNIEVYGNALFGFGFANVLLNGGDCTSTDENHLSGSGGGILVLKTLNSITDINLNGGNRDGYLTAGGSSFSKPDGGDLIVWGGAIIQGISSVGGNISTTGGFSPCGAGYGGNIIVIGDLKCTKSGAISYSINVSGGDINTGTAGRGGQITVGGDLSCDEDILSYGGASDGDAGDGGEIRCNGYLYCGGNIALYGGTALQSNAGDGGNIEVLLDVNSFNIYLYGGNCNSTLEAKSAGNGGYITCRSLNTTIYDIDLSITNYYDINVSAGSRAGSTTVTASNSAADPGKIVTVCDLFCGNIDGYGSSCLTDYPNSVGGAGATVNVNGNLKCNNIYLNGGDSVGNDGGNGGQLTVGGLASFYELKTIGGQSNDSVGEGPLDATVNGNGGNIEFSSGVCCSIINNNDGAGSGVAPSGAVELLLSGHCSIGTIDSAARIDVRIKPSSDEKNVILKINSMPDKQTLNNNDNTETPSIFADLDDSLFMSNSNNSPSWYKVSGTPIV